MRKLLRSSNKSMELMIPLKTEWSQKGKNIFTRKQVERVCAFLAMSIILWIQSVPVYAQLGETWTEQTIESSAWKSVAYGNGRFVAVSNDYLVNVPESSGGIATSEDGVNWTFVKLSVAYLNTVNFVNGKFVIIPSKTLSSNDIKILYSEDGLNWTPKYMRMNGAIRHNYTDVKISSIAYGFFENETEGVYLAVTDTTGSLGVSSAILRSNDLEFWSVLAPMPNRMKSIVYADNRFVAVGPGLAFVVKKNSVSGILSGISVPSNEWNSVVFGNGKFVAVSSTGVGNRVMSSSDGLKWTEQSSAEDNKWNQVVYYDGLFVAIAESGTSRVMKSTDGISWTPQVSSAQKEWKSVAGGNGLLLKVGKGDKFMTSGAYTAPSLPIFTGETTQTVVGTSVKLNDSASNLSGYKTSEFGWYVGIGASPTSKLGNENEVLDPSSGAITAYISGLQANTTYHARPYATTILGTGYGEEITFTTGASLPGQATFEEVPETGAFMISALTFDDGLWIGMNKAKSGNSVLTSPDAINWTFRKPALNTEWRSIASNGSMLVATSPKSFLDSNGDSLIMTSSDGGVSWVRRQTHERTGNEYFTGIAYGNGRFVTVSENRSGLYHPSHISNDGINWTAGGSNLANCLTFGNGLFISAGRNRIRYSTDGELWTDATSISNALDLKRDFISIIYGNGAFVAVNKYKVDNDTISTFHRVARSTDGIHWNTYSIPIAVQLLAVTYTEGIFVATYFDPNSQDSGTLVSIDGIGWSVGQVFEKTDKISNLSYSNGILLGSTEFNSRARILKSGVYVESTDKPAKVITSNVNYISSNSAFLEAEVLKYGGNSSNERGFVYGTTQNPTLTNTRIIVDAGNGTFSTPISSLNASTTYYVRAYAITNNGTVYGNQVSFITPTLSVPNVVTNDATLITKTSAVLGGSATNNGMGNERGIVWSVTSNPTVADNKVQMGTGDGPFSQTVTGFEAGKTYYVRAYAQNTQGISYGSQITVTMQQEELLGYNWNQATVDIERAWNNVVYGNGRFLALEQGLIPYVYGNDDLNYRLATSEDGQNWTVIRTLTTDSYLSNLFFVNDRFILVTNTTTAYYSFDGSDWVEFQMPLAGNWTDIIYDEDQYVAIRYKQLQDLEGALATSSDGINWTQISAPPNETRWQTLRKIGNLYIMLGTNYIATSLDLESWNIKSNTYANAEHYFNVATMQDAIVVISARGYSVSFDNTETWTRYPVGGFSDIIAVNGQFMMSKIDGTMWISPDGRNWNQYPMLNQAFGNMAYANGAIIMTRSLEFESHSGEIYFSGSFIPGSPEVSTQSITSILTQGATVNSSISSSGEIVERGVVYGQVSLPTVNDTKIVSGSGTGSFQTTITGLNTETNYFVRAYALAENRVWYGEQLSFRTSIGVARTDTLYALTTSSIKLKGVINGVNSSERGFVMGSEPNPTLANTKIVSGSGSGSYESDVTGLTATNTYHVRAYAIESGGTVHYGRSMLLKLPRQSRPVILPENTVAQNVFVGFVNSKSVMLRGIGSAPIDNSSITHIGVLLSTGENPEYNLQSIAKEVPGRSLPYLPVTGLYPQTAYKARLYLKDADWGIILADTILSFTTPEETAGEDWQVIPHTEKKSFSSITVGLGLFVAAGPDVISKSTDGGETWTDITMPSTETWRKVVYMNRKFFAFAENGYYISSDAINWSAKKSIPVPVNDAAYGKLSYQAGLEKQIYIAVSSTASYRSADGESWNEILEGTNPIIGNAVAIEKDVAVIVRDALAGGNTPSMYHSKDAITWTANTAGTGMEWRDVVYFQNGFTAVGYNPVALKDVRMVISSISNGVATGAGVFTALIENQLRANAVMDNILLTVADNGYIISLRKGMYETTENLVLTAHSFSDVAFDFGRAVAVSPTDSLNTYISGTFTPLQAPQVSTLQPELGSNGLILFGALLEETGGSKDDFSYGFVYGKDGAPDLTVAPEFRFNAPKWEYSETVPGIAEKRFVENIYYQVRPFDRYFVRAFATNQIDTVYGNQVEYFVEGDLTAWSIVSTPGNNEFKRIAEGNGNIVAISQSNTSILKSNDGVDFELLDLPIAEGMTFNDVSYIDGWFYICSYIPNGNGNTVLKSQDATNWSEDVLPFGTNPLSYKKLDNRYFISDYTNLEALRSYTSTDGINWDEMTFSSFLFGYMTRVIYVDNTYWAMFYLQDGALAKSSNGIDWTVVSTESLSNVITDLAYSNGKFVLSCENGNVGTSDDGEIWSDLQLPITDQPRMHGIAQANGYFVAVGAYGKVAESPDGLNWTAANIGIQDDITSIITTPTGFYATVSGGTNGGILKRTLGEPGIPAFTKHSREIAGTAGWRMLSAPKPDFSVGVWAGLTAVQGVPNGMNPTATPNFYTYGSSGSWLSPTSLDESVASGYGFILKFFNNENAGSKKLPIVLKADGSEPTEDVTVNLNKTVLSGSENESAYFTLLGNPFGTRLPLNDLALNNGGQLSEHVWVWDNELSDYALIPRSTSVLEPWQGFWAYVLPSSEATSVTYPFSKRTMSTATTALFKQVAVDSTIGTFNLLKGGKPTSYPFTVRLQKDALLTLDKYDAQKLVPLADSFAVISGRQLASNALRAIEALPLELTKIVELAIIPQIVNQGGSYDLNWSGFDKFPENVLVEIQDLETGETYDARVPGSINFEQIYSKKSQAKQTSTKKSNELIMQVPDGRFRLRITPNTVLATEEALLPKEISLTQNYPNPFNPTTTIRYALPTMTNVNLVVYDILGRQVSTLVDGLKPAGVHQISFDARRLASGMYLYRLEAGDKVFIKKMILIK